MEAAVVRNDPGCDEHAEEGDGHGDQEADGGGQVGDGNIHGHTGEDPGQPHQAGQQTGHTRTPSLNVLRPEQENYVQFNRIEMGKIKLVLVRSF